MQTETFTPLHFIVHPEEFLLSGFFSEEPVVAELIGNSSAERHRLTRLLLVIHSCVSIVSTKTHSDAHNL